MRIETVPDALALLPPHSVDAEQAVLGGLLLDNSAWERIADRIAPSDFYRADHRTLFSALARMIDTGQPADVVTVCDTLERAGTLADVGGLAYVTALAQNTPSSVNIRRYSDIIRERARRRQILSLAAELDEGAHSSADVADVIAAAEARLLAMQTQGVGEPVEISRVIADAVEYVDQRAQHPGELSGIATGYRDFDRLTGGLEPGDLVIVAARPSMGKTAWVLGVAEHAAARTPVLFCSLEMPQRQLGLRLISAHAGVSVHAMRTGAVAESAWSRIAAVKGTMSESRLEIDDTPAVSTSYVRARARRMKRTRGLGLIVIDYLQLMRGDNREGKRVYEVGSISRALKALAKELHVPVLACAQLNRAVETRPNRRPLMSDLRDSGEVEQDADIIAMLHREEVYNENDPQWRGLAELIMRKQRNGPIGTCWLAYSAERMKFGNYDGAIPVLHESTKRRTGFDSE